MTFRAIDKHECDEVRAAAAVGRDYTLNTPYLDKRRASGRARCRQCGERIRKGEPELVFAYSFTDGGSYNGWTAIEVHIHRRDCGEEAA